MPLWAWSSSHTNDGNKNKNKITKIAIPSLPTAIQQNMTNIYDHEANPRSSPGHEQRKRHIIVLNIITFSHCHYFHQILASSDQSKKYTFLMFSVNHGCGHRFWRCLPDEHVVFVLIAYYLAGVELHIAVDNTLVAKARTDQSVKL